MYPTDLTPKTTKPRDLSLANQTFIHLLQAIRQNRKLLHAGRVADVTSWTLGGSLGSLEKEFGRKPYTNPLGERVDTPTHWGRGLIHQPIGGEGWYTNPLGERVDTPTHWGRGLIHQPIGGEGWYNTFWVKRNVVHHQQQIFWPTLQGMEI